jgi:hypothetical protein
MSDPKSLYANIDFDYVRDESEEKLALKQELAFKYFYHLNKSSKIINDSKGLRALNFTFLNKNSRNQIQTALAFDFVKILISIIETSYQRLIECFKLKEITEASIENRTSSLVVALMSVDILGNYTAHSKKVCFKFYEENGLKSLFNLLNNRTIQQSIVKFKSDSSLNQEFVLIKGVIKSVLYSFLNLAKYYHHYLSQWNNCNSLKNLLFYLNLMSGSMESKINTTLTVSFIAGDHDFHKNISLKSVLEDNIKLISSCSRKIETKLKLKRKLFQLEDEKEPIEICYLSYLDNEWNLIVLLNAIQNFVACDNNKYDIYFKCGMNKCLRSIICYGNDFEIASGLEILWELCLNKNIASEIKEDRQFYQYISSLVKTKRSNRYVNFNASGVLWSIENYFREHVYIDDSTRNEHIMICYEKDSIELCLMIKKKLEESKYKVWIHTKEAYDLGLESMAIGIENSLCVIICFNEKFKLNVMCRLQAEYAHKINKSIIPVITNADWKPADEW